MNRRAGDEHLNVEATRAAWHSLPWRLALRVIKIGLTVISQRQKPRCVVPSGSGCSSPTNPPTGEPRQDSAPTITHAPAEAPEVPIRFIPPDFGFRATVVRSVLSDTCEPCGSYDWPCVDRIRS